MATLNEYARALTMIADNYHGRAITATQAIEQIKGVLVVLEIKEDHCSAAVREKVQRQRSIGKGFIAELQKLGREDKGVPDVPDPLPGYNRQWLQCHECGKRQYYDYAPYSLSFPVLVSVCGHDINDMERIKL